MEMGRRSFPSELSKKKLRKRETERGDAVHGHKSHELVSSALLGPAIKSFTRIPFCLSSTCSLEWARWALSPCLKDSSCGNN